MERKILAHGRSLNVTEWASHLGIKYATIEARLRRGWSNARALSATVQRYERHGFSNNHPLYRTWMGMRERCTRPRNKMFPFYGARGIRVCKRWQSFAAFVSDMGEKPFPASTIERINNNGNYTPKNCRWATKSEQALNRRSNVRLTYDGRTQTVTEWAREIGVDSRVIFCRLDRGKSPAQAIEGHDARYKIQPKGTP